MKILTEASGSLVSAYLIKAIKELGYISVASDITTECFSKYLADEYLVMPNKNDRHLWEKTFKLIKENNINIVIPSLDETLLAWSERKEYFRRHNVHVILSDSDVIRVFQDKWLTYKFFRENNIPTPRTSLKQEFSLIKPRFGRGSIGVYKTSKKINMDGNISQEYINGTEYTIDVFCDKNSNPVYIVPRKRLNVKDGKSTAGIVVKHEKIINYVKAICSATKFIGPINIQCIETTDGEIKFIEVNPRIAGGMALGFAATENWIKLIVDHFVYGKEIKPVPVKYGLKMMRYYNEIFTFE